MKHFVVPVALLAAAFFTSCSTGCHDCEVLDANRNSLGMYTACGPDPTHEAINNFCTSCSDEEKSKMAAKCVELETN